MENEEKKYLINRFYDNELNETEEIELFNSLAQSGNLRDYFKKYNLLKQAVYNDIKPFPGGLDKKIQNGGAAVKEVQPVFIQNIYGLIPYAAAVIFLILTLVYSGKSDSYEKQIISLTREVENQNTKIELLFRALPPIEVTPDYKKTNQIYYNR